MSGWGYNHPPVVSIQCVDVSQHKPIHGFSQTFQDMFNEIGTRCLNFVEYLATEVAMVILVKIQT